MPANISNKLRTKNINSHHLKDTAGGETQGERRAQMFSLHPFCGRTSSNLSGGFADPKLSAGNAKTSLCCLLK